MYPMNYNSVMQSRVAEVNGINGANAYQLAPISIYHYINEFPKVNIFDFISNLLLTNCQHSVILLLLAVSQQHRKKKGEKCLIKNF